MSRTSTAVPTHVSANTPAAQVSATTTTPGGYQVPPPNTPPQETLVTVKKGKTKTSAGAFYGLVFLVTLIIAFFVFYLMKPSIVMKKFNDRPIDEIDWVKVLIASVIVAILVTALVWIVRAFIMKP